MGCPKLLYYPGEEGLEKSVVYFLGDQAKKEVPRKICDNYYPFGLTFNSYKRTGAKENKMNTFQDQELITDLDLNWVQFKWRNHDPAIGRFFNVDPLAEDYYYNSPYAFSENKVISHIELEGLEAVFAFDQAARPQDNGTAGTSYTADFYVVHDNGSVAGPYRGSTYPNSVSNSDNSPAYKTVNEGTHNYSNNFGHSSGEKNGLNLGQGEVATGAPPLPGKLIAMLNLGQGEVATHPERNVPGTTPDGKQADVMYANVHEGTSDKGNSGSRGSQACLTIKPADSKEFFSNFDNSGSYNGHSGNTGNSKGTVSIYRGDSNASSAAKYEINFKQSDSYQQLIKPTVQSDATRTVIQKPLIND